MQQLESDMEQLKDLKLGKENDKVYIVTWLFNLYVGYIIQYAALDKSEAGIKIPGRSINIHRYEDDTTLTAGSKIELKSLSMRRGDEETSLRSIFKKTIHKKTLNIHGIQSQHFMAYRWGKSGNSGRFYFLGLQNHYGQWLHLWN